MNKFTLLAAAAVMTLGVAACDNQTEQTTERTMPNGTTVETTVTRESDGDSVNVERETRINPEGAMNERTVTEEYEVDTDRPMNNDMR
tara:strand:- start:162 stop:425 length:264 start_codon:yes stop_codon:yes gene_type:complete